MRVTVVIPARGGSDRVPYLNIKRLGDAPLLAHTIRAAKEAKGIDRIIVSTDDETVAEVAREHGAEVPFLRPKELSGDLSSLMPVVRHATQESEKGHPRADVVVVLQATTPFRTARSINEALEKIRTQKLSAVVSVTSDLSLRWQAEDGKLRPLFDRAGRRDEQTPVYLENGAIVAIHRDVLDQDTRFGDAVGFVVLDKREGFTVHDLEDFWMAERLLREPRILFRVDGSRVMGMGHVYRSLAIAEALREGSRAEIAFLMSADHAEGIATISKSGYPVRVFRSGGLEALIDSIRDFAPSVVINDLPLVEDTYLRSLARLGAITINLVDTLDDLEGVSRDAQFVISVMNEDRETPEGFYGGPAFAILRRHFQGREKAIRDKPTKVLLTFGGADPQALTLKVAKALSPLSSEIEIVSIAGPAFPHRLMFQALQRTLGGNLPLVNGVDVQIADLMLDADVVLCSGGMSVYEIAALGVPGIVLAQNAKEDRRMREFSRFGTIEYLGLGVDVLESAVLEAVRRILLDKARRAAMSERGRSLVDGYGAARAAEIVLEQVQADSNGKTAKAAAREGME